MTLTRTEILQLVDSKPWFHRFTLVDGITTSGLYSVDAHAWVDEAFRRLDLRGKRVLEIGTWDGPYAFALEARGALVEATDIQDPDETGFNVAKRILDSKVNYTRVSVYDVGRHFPPASFDYILFLGVFYHLKYPVLAMEALSQLLKNGGRLFFEGECLLNHAQRADGRAPGWLDRGMISILGRSKYPVSLYYSGQYKDDDSNWHVPNLACLEEWMKTAGLQIESHRCDATSKGVNRFPTQRVSGVAVKAGEPRPEHPMVEDIATMLHRAKMVRAQREREQLTTWRSIVSRSLDRCLAPLGLRRTGYRITRAPR